MPQMKDAAVLIVGTIIEVGKKLDGDRKQTGVRVTLMVPDGQDGAPGFAVVNLRLEDAALVNLDVPRVAWIVRPAPYDIADGDGRRNTGMSVRFVRPVNENDLDLIVSSAPVASGK